MNKLLFFHGSYCNPCKSMEPVVDKVVSKHKDIVLEKYLIDDESGMDKANEYHIRQVPFLVLTDDSGDAINYLCGVNSAEAVEEFIKC